MPDNRAASRAIEIALEMVLEARAEERARCVAEIRRIQKRNTATADGKSNTWNYAVKTMADECADAIETLGCG